MGEIGVDAAVVVMSSVEVEVDDGVEQVGDTACG